MSEKNNRTMSDIRPGRSVDAVNRTSVKPAPMPTKAPAPAPIQIVKAPSPAVDTAPKPKRLRKILKVLATTLLILAAAGGVVYLALIYYR